MKNNKNFCSYIRALFYINCFSIFYHSDHSGTLMALLKLSIEFNLRKANGKLFQVSGQIQRTLYLRKSY